MMHFLPVSPAPESASAMQIQLLTAVAQCGDGMRNGTEECDDGNTESGVQPQIFWGFHSRWDLDSI